jgi:seryl-tRNA synthetase
VLDRRYVAENVDLVADNCRRRGSSADVARFAELDRLRRQMQADIDRLNQQAGQVSRSIAGAADAAEREARKAEGRRLREEVSAFEAKLAEVIADSDAILRTIPNLTHPAAPVGGEDARSPATASTSSPTTRCCSSWHCSGTRSTSSCGAASP